MSESAGGPRSTSGQDRADGGVDGSRTCDREDVWPVFKRFAPSNRDKRPIACVSSFLFSKGRRPLKYTRPTSK